MCMMNYKSVSEYNSPCGSCPEYLNNCEWCSCYDDCMNGGVDDEAIKL